MNNRLKNWQLVQRLMKFPFNGYIAPTKMLCKSKKYSLDRCAIADYRKLCKSSINDDLPIKAFLEKVEIIARRL